MTLNHLMKMMKKLLLTFIVSWVGTWPGPPPVFSGLKLDVTLRKKLGFNTYPQRPLGRKRPWFKSICSPDVWKFRATAQQTKSEVSNMINLSTYTPTQNISTSVNTESKSINGSDINVLWSVFSAGLILHFFGIYWVTTSCFPKKLTQFSTIRTASLLLHWSTNPSGSHHSTFPEDHSWMIGGAGQRGRSGSAACCCVLQKAFLQMKR